MNMKKNIAGVVVIVLLAFSLFVNRSLYFQNRDLKKNVSELKSDPSIQAKEEVKTLVKKLSSLVVLPEGEDPVVATVTDKDKLSDQPAFAKAENGDKLLIYGQAGKAYLFDPKNDKLKDIIPVNVGENGQVAGATATPTPTVVNLKVALVNGTDSDGATANGEKKIKESKVAGLTISAKTTAKKNDYQKTMVIDISGKNKDRATALAKALSAELAGLPEGEDKPNTDLMVLLGADFK